MTNMTEIISTWKLQGIRIVQLLNREGIPVAALYLDKLNIDKLAILESKTSEKYYLYIDGIAIFFTSYMKSETI